MTFQPQKLFTPAEARRTLPLVKRIVEDILNLSHEMHTMAKILGKDAEDHPQILEKMQECTALLQELEALGCYFKDWSFQVGLVDFPAEIEGHVVFLCWRSDEPDITHYHEIDAGYAGRRPIPKPYLE